MGHIFLSLCTGNSPCVDGWSLWVKLLSDWAFCVSFFKCWPFFFFLSWQVGELLADLIEPFKICFSVLGSGSVLAFSLGTEMLCHVVRLKHWVINEISACWLVRFWTQSSRSSGNRSSFMVFTKPMEFQCTHTQDSATNSRGCSAFLTLFFFNGSVFSGSLSRTLQLTRLPQSPVVFGSGKHCVLSRRQAGSQDDHGTQLFCFPSLGCTACCLMSSKCFP